MFGFAPWNGKSVAWFQIKMFKLHFFFKELPRKKILWIIFGKNTGEWTKVFSLSHTNRTTPTMVEKANQHGLLCYPLFTEQAGMKPAHSVPREDQDGDSSLRHRISIKDLVNDHDEDVTFNNLKSATPLSTELSENAQKVFECKWGTCSVKCTDFDDYMNHVSSHLVKKPWKCEWRKYLLFFHFRFFHFFFFFLDNPPSLLCFN